MADNAIGILFGVLGGGNIKGESGKLIQSQLEELSKNIRLEININEDYFKEQLAPLKAEIQKQLGNLEIDVKAKVKSQDVGGGSSGTRTVRQQEVSYSSLKKTLEQLYQTRIKLSRLSDEEKSGTVEGVLLVKKARELGESYGYQLEQLKKLHGADSEYIKDIQTLRAELEKAYSAERGSDTLTQQDASYETTVSTLERLYKAKSQLAKLTLNGEEDTVRAQALSQEIQKLQGLYDKQYGKLKEILGADDERIKKVQQLNAELERAYGAEQTSIGSEVEFDELKKQLIELYTTYGKLDKEFNISSKKYKELDSQAKEAEAKYEKALSDATSRSAVSEKRLAELKELKDKLEEARIAQQALNQATQQDKMANNLQMGFKGLVAKVEALNERYVDLIKHNKDAAEAMEKLRALANSDFRGADGWRDENGVVHNADYTAATDQINKLAQATKDTAAQFSKLEAQSDTLGKKIRETFANKIIQTFTYALIGLVTRALKQTYDNVKALDKAITDLQIATGLTREETAQLVNEYAKLAKQLGATVTEVTSAADTWLRQGYTVAETNQLISYTLMLSKLGQLESADAAKALTSAMKGYKVEVNDAIRIVDKFTAVDMEAAASAGDIATAMAETATSADIAGVSMDKLIGYIAIVKEVTQDGAESVGTFYKTLFARMGNVKAGKFVDEETGESLNDVETVLSSVGVSLRGANGLFKDFGDVLDEVAAKWEGYSNVQQHTIATAFAGTRQQEKFIVLMENYGDALKYANTAATSAGTAQSKFDAAYLNSIEAKLNALTAAWQEFSSAALNSTGIKIIVEILTMMVNAMSFLMSHINIGIVLVPILTTLIGKLGTKGVIGIIKLVKSLATVNKRLKETKQKANEATNAVSEFVNTKGNGKTVEELNDIYELSCKNTDQLGYIQRVTGMSKDDAQEFIDLKIQETQATRNAQAAQAEHAKTMQAAMYGAIGILTTILSLTSSIEGDAGNIITLVVAGIALVGIAISMFFSKVRNGILGISAAEKTSVILTLISVIFTIIAAIITAIAGLVKTDAELKEAARENAKAAQEEADALREISDAAKEASDSISSLIDEIKEASERMSNAEWVDYIDKLGSEVNNIFSGEELSSLQAINKLLGTAYTYQDLMNMSTQERLKLLDDLNAAQLEETRIQERATYEKQKAASNEKTRAAGMREKITTKANYVVDEFLNEIYKGNEDGIDLANTGGRRFKVTVNSTDSQDFVNKVKKITDAYEAKYKYNLAALQDNEIYKYFSGLLSEGQEALKTQTADFINYLTTSVNVEGLKLKVDLDAENAQVEYDRVIREIVANLEKDSTISVALAEGLIDGNTLNEYATKFIASHYEELYNKINPQSVIVSLKKLETMLEEVEGKFDILSDAMEDMSDMGILSADTIKSLKEEFPELMEYVQETAEGFILMDGALSSYLNGISEGYMNAVKQAQVYFDAIYAAYEASSEKTIEQYQIVIDAQNNLNNAIKNAENWRITEATLSKDGLIEQYTELLEEQQDVLDEQCDKYKELCELRKDLLETYQEELDYQRELANKQNNVADLQTRLALAKLDNSAAGKAKQRELQSQLDEAKDELDEYTLEHAIEDITKDIENSESAYEKFIQERIDEISSKIEAVVLMSTEQISSAITKLGETPIVLDTGNGSSTSTSGEYNDTINSGKESANKEISDATVAPEEETEPVFLTSGKLNSGVSIGKGLAGLSNNARHNDDVDVIINGTTYDLLAGSIADSKIVHKLNSLNGGAASAGDIVVYDGALYIYDKKGDWRKMADDHSSASSAAAKYLQLLNEQETHHTGGFAGNATDLKSNEVFAKLLKGEFVSTPKQMDTFMKQTLPWLMNQGDSTKIEYNSPIIEIKCDSITESSLPKLEDIINKAVKIIQKDMSDALSRTGYRKQH